MSGELFGWWDKGDRLELDPRPGGGALILRVGNDSTSCAIELDGDAVRGLVDVLLECDDDRADELAELEHERTELVEERDEAVARAEALERKIVERDRLLDVATARIERVESGRDELLRRLAEALS